MDKIKRNKFFNVKTKVVDFRDKNKFISFDSKAEANRYKELVLLLKTGKIRDLELQKKFNILPSFDFEGEHFRPLTYKADFYYFDNELKKFVVEDVKGKTTKEFKIKKKILAFYHKIYIKEIYNNNKH